MKIKSVKRNPGEWLIRKILARALFPYSCLMMGLGWLGSIALASYVYSVSIVPIRMELLLSVLPGLALIVIGLIAAWKTTQDRYSIRNMRKGMEAEAYIGRIIEWAISKKDCAVAHNLSALGKFGDIDHLVATPQGLWVIETKAKRVPRRKWNSVLRSIALNVEGVRREFPGVKVVGAVIFSQPTK